MYYWKESFGFGTHPFPDSGALEPWRRYLSLLSPSTCGSAPLEETVDEH